MAHALHTFHSGLNLGERFRAFVDAYKTARKLHADYARTVKELNSLSDRDLMDLGLSRYDIHTVVHKHVYGG